MVNYFNTYSIEIYIGEPRSGKTLAMVAETHEDTKNLDVKIYSNMWLNPKHFKHVIPISMKDLILFYKNKEEFTNSIFVLDELHQFMDARDFSNKSNKAIGYFVGQLGKRGNTLRGTTHFMNLLDVRLRMYCERKVFIKKGILTGNQWKPLLNNNRVLSEVENAHLYVKAESVVRKMINYDFYHVKDNITYIKASKYFDFYDTHELIAKDDVAEVKKDERD
jgi:hypothetical protein